jgi:hypothetical protein
MLLFSSVPAKLGKKTQEMDNFAPNFPARVVGPNYQAAQQDRLRHGAGLYRRGLTTNYGRRGVTVSYPQVMAETPVGAASLLADGNIALQVEEKGEGLLRRRVVGVGSYAPGRG